MRRVPGEPRQRIRGEGLEVPVEEPARSEVGVPVPSQDVAQRRRRAEKRVILAPPDPTARPVHQGDPEGQRVLERAQEHRQSGWMRQCLHQLPTLHLDAEPRNVLAGRDAAPDAVPGPAVELEQLGDAVAGIHLELGAGVARVSQTLEQMGDLLDQHRLLDGDLCRGHGSERGERRPQVPANHRGEEATLAVHRGVHVDATVEPSWNPFLEDRHPERPLDPANLGGQLLPTDHEPDAAGTRRASGLQEQGKPDQVGELEGVGHAPREVRLRARTPDLRGELRQGVLVHRLLQNRPLRDRHRDAPGGEPRLVLRQDADLGVPRGEDGVDALPCADVQDGPDVRLLGLRVLVVDPAPLPVASGEGNLVRRIHETGHGRRSKPAQDPVLPVDGHDHTGRVRPEGAEHAVRLAIPRVGDEKTQGGAGRLREGGLGQGLRLTYGSMAHARSAVVVHSTQPAGQWSAAAPGGAL